ncbi:a26269f5-6cb0-4d93-a971-a183b4cfcf2a [Thermothielavioides terrestris]|uniref:A26269f5-6cb0-4d93-a971-a183b4cfcf2a n=1 Tax=Thermothielavioides terrestris TaxID=2587410 RepID=A0A446BYA8_9PEZI|nr:a26269f5-6cb0-4d93-a971-a183b4cfcf2a [Thermothielavioides terrestris]
MAVTYEPPRGDVVAALNFYAPPEDGSAPYNLAGDVPPGVTPRNYGTDTQQVLIRDARGREADFTLDKDAFQIILNQPPSAEKSFTDDASIEKNYYPRLSACCWTPSRAPTKSSSSTVHTIRRTSPDSKRQPVARVHIDQTASSTIKRVRRHASSAAEADALLAGRYRIINVWRPLNARPVESFPLAFASSATVRDADVVPVEHRYPASAGGYVGQTAAIRHSPGQEWWYLSGMTGDERILLECFDSEALREGSGVQGGRVAHSAFEDPRTRKGAEGRESIEVRALF